MNARHRITTWGLVAVAAMVLMVGGMSLLQVHRITAPLYNQLPLAIAGVEKNSHLNHLAQLIRYYDEVLAQSARNYAFTQDRQWRERYLVAEPELDRCLKAAMQIGNREDLRLFRSIDLANQALVAMEHQSLAHVDAGRAADAGVILEGAEYRRQKEIYAQGLERYARGRSAELKHALTVSGRTLEEAVTSGREAASGRRWEVISIVVALMAVGFTGRFAFRFAGAEDKRLQMEAERQEIESRYRALFDTSSDAVMTLDADRFLDCNAATLKMFGFTTKEAFTAVHPADISPPSQPSGLDSRTAADQRIAEAFARGTNRFEWIHRRRNGEDFHADVLHTAFQSGDRRILQAIVRDISHRKRAEDALVRAAAEWEETFDALHAYVAIIGADCVVVRANRAFRQAFAGKQVVGARCYPLIHGTETRPKDCVSRSAFATGEPGHAELQEPRLGNRWFDVSAAPIKDADGTVSRIVHIMRDITERKATEALQRQTEAQLQQQQRLASVGTLARGMAHEINNPLNGIMNYAQLIKDKAAGNAPLAEFADEIIAESRRMAQMTHSLLNFTEQADMQSVAPATPAQMVASVLPPFSEAARERGIALSCDIPADLPRVSCRRGQIGRVVKTLLTNAMEALEEGRAEGRGDKTIRLTAQRLDSAGRTWLRLTVEDNGPGMPETIRDRAFDPFFTTKDRTRHSGLGLWIGRSVVQEHGGEMSMESEVGQWTRCHVDLPVA